MLDRPNPINGVAVQGPISNVPESFVNYHALPVRHGMTVGELAQFFNQQRKIRARLRVIRMENWRRTDWFDETGIAWVNPSPALRNMNAEILYPESPCSSKPMFLLAEGHRIRLSWWEHRGSKQQSFPII